MRSGCWSVFIVLALLGTVRAAEPVLRNLDVRGLQAGGVTTLTIDGAELTEPKLVLPFPVTRQELKPGATPTRVIVEVETPAETVPGLYNLRLATAGGISSPVVIGVDRFPQTPFAVETAAIPASLHGQIGGSQVIETKFAGKAGQPLTIEVEAQRLGSKLRPVLHLLDSTRKQLAWSMPSPTHGGDARLSATLPADGVYSVQLHDAEYGVPGPGFYRLKIGDWKTVEQVFPPAIERGKSATLEWLGSNAKGQLPMAAATNAAALALGWPEPGLSTGIRPAIQISDLPEVLEQRTESQPQNLAIPSAVSGRLLAPNEIDRYRLAVEPGQKLRFEAFGERIGSPLDLVLVIENEQGGALVRGDDSPGTTDPVLEYTVPANTPAIVLAVSDLQGHSGERCIYRVVAEQLEPKTARKDFQLHTPTDRLIARPGERALLPVLVERRGEDGPVRLSLEGLPAGVNVAGAEIPAGEEGTLVEVMGTNPAPSAALLRFAGASAEGASRLGTFEAHPLASVQPWLAEEVALATAAPSGFLVDWGEIPADAQLILAGKLTLPVKVVRPMGDATAVRMTLVTTQIVPRVPNTTTPDPNRTLRIEQNTVELAPTANDGQVSIFIPGDLKSPAYGLSIKGELLSKDKQTVLATSFTAPRKFPVLNPVALQFAGEPKLEFTQDPKANVTVKLAGKIERRGGFASVVTLTPAGAPPGVQAPAINVPADKSDFELTFVFPANFAVGEMKGLKVTAAANPNPAAPQLRVQTPEVAIPIKVNAPAQ